MNSYGLPGLQQQIGVMAPPTWFDAAMAIAAAMKDAGASLQHEPQAADNVARLVQSRVQNPVPAALRNNLLLTRLLQAAPVARPAISNGLPPAIAALMLLQQLRQPGAAVPAAAAPTAEAPALPPAETPPEDEAPGLALRSGGRTKISGARSTTAAPLIRASTD